MVYRLRLHMARVGAAAMIAALALACVLAASPRPAQAEEDDLSLLQQKIESSAADYNAAQESLAALEQQMADNQARIAEITEEIPQQRECANEALRVLYVVQSEGMSLVDLVLGSEDLSDFIRKVDYLDAIHTHSTAQVRKLADLKAELEQTEADLEAAAQQAREEADRASRALEAAQASRKQAEEKAAALAAAQAAAAQAAAAANEPAPSYVDEEEYAEDEDWGVDSENPEVDLSQEDTSGNVDGSVSQGEVDWSADRDGFVAEWGGRIDGYLAGTPLGGYGATFAAAAWDYGVDPRWSPAISCIESSCGEYCFREHNAWGWGSVSWDSWDEAIYDHVAGLARVYGSTITVEAAQKYCPPNSTHWYNAVLGEMNSI